MEQEQVLSLTPHQYAPNKESLSDSMTMMTSTTVNDLSINVNSNNYMLKQQQHNTNATTNSPATTIDSIATAPIDDNYSHHDEHISSSSTPSPPLARRSSHQQQHVVVQSFETPRDLVFYMIRDAEFREFLISGLQLFHHMITTATSSSSSDDNDQEKQECTNQMQSLINTMQHHPSYTKALYSIVVILDEYRVRRVDVTDNTNSTTTTTTTTTAYTSSGKHGDHQFKEMLRESYQILGEFVKDREELDEFKKQFLSLFQQLRRDGEARALLSNLKQYIRQVTSDQNTDNCTTDNMTRWISRVRKWSQSDRNDKYQDSLQQLLTRGILLLQSINYGSTTVASSDTTTTTTGSAAATTPTSLSSSSTDNSIYQHLDSYRLTSSTSSPVSSCKSPRPEDLLIAEESVEKLRQMIVPLVQKQLETIPMPMIQVQKDKYEFKLENLTLNGLDLVQRSLFNLQIVRNTKAMCSDQSRKQYAKIKLRANGMNFSIPNMHFSYKRHKIPKLEDHGIADINLLDNGLKIHISWNVFLLEGDDQNRARVTIELANVKCFIDRTEIHVKEAQHKVFSRVATKLFSGTIRKSVASVIVDKIRDTLEPLDQQINQFFSNTATTTLQEQQVPQEEVAKDIIPANSHVTTVEPIAQQEPHNSIANVPEMNDTILQQENKLHTVTTTTIPTTVIRGRRGSVTISNTYANVQPGTYELSSNSGISLLPAQKAMTSELSTSSSNDLSDDISTPSEEATTIGDRSSLDTLTSSKWSHAWTKAK